MENKWINIVLLILVGPVGSAYWILSFYLDKNPNRKQHLRQRKVIRIFLVSFGIFILYHISCYAIYVFFIDEPRLFWAVFRYLDPKGSLVEQVFLGCFLFYWISLIPTSLEMLTYTRPAKDKKE